MLGRYYDCVVWRTYRQSDLEEFAELAGVPVINGLTDYAHPCQVLADLMTIQGSAGAALRAGKLCFVGDGGSMANSLIVGGLLAGMQVTCVCPQSYRPAADVLMFAHKYGSAFHLTADPAEGIQDADVVATAVWNTASPARRKVSSSACGFCGLPAHRQAAGKRKARCHGAALPARPPGGGDLLGGVRAARRRSLTSAENRLHVQKAVLAILSGGK